VDKRLDAPLVEIGVRSEGIPQIISVYLVIYSINFTCEEYGSMCAN